MSGTENSGAGVVALENGAVDSEANKTTILSETISSTLTAITTTKIVEEMSVTHSSSATSENRSGDEAMSEKNVLDRQRICLVGSVVDDNDTVQAAKRLNVPIVTSETGAEIATDTTWTTFFVMRNFEGPMFDAIRKTKHRIYGPPALQQVSTSKDSLVYVNRPIYNFAMKGVITCFTGIRKKDELTRLVNYIHAMGGSIRKDLNSKLTHLICNASSGEKYQYAMTFRLTVIRSSWVYEAWNRREDPTFFATMKSFTDEHRLKAFEGLRICFFGFPADENQHMIDVLKSNSGIPTDLEDPECSHVIISNNAEHFPEQTGSTSPPALRLPPNSVITSSASSASGDKFSPPDGLEKLNLNDNGPKTAASKLNEDIQPIIVTPKKSKKFNDENCDGVVLPGNADNEFVEPANISPILHNIEEEEETESNGNGDDVMSKRKRDSFDNTSMISTDSFAPVFNSAKKPKLIRTGSITRSLRRSMSFVALKNPITNMIRVRRNSIDPNSSINSVTSMESTFSESIKKPVREKIQNLRDRIMKNSNRSKRDFCLTPKLSRVADAQNCASNNTNDNFISPSEINAISCKKFINSTLIDTPKVNVMSNATTTGQNEVMNTECADDGMHETDDTDSVAIVPSKPPSVTDDQTDKQDPKSCRTHIVKPEWFWYTIQNGYADEMDYLFGDYLESIAHMSGDRRDSLPVSLNKRKRKRFSIRNAADSLLGASGKRRSSVSDAALSVSGSFLDYTASPSCKHESKGKTD